MLHIRNLRLHWERREGTAYLYTVEASADGEQWTTIVDESKNEDKHGIRAHKVDSPHTRYLKTTFLGSSTNGWGSLWESERIIAAVKVALAEADNSLAAHRQAQLKRHVVKLDGVSGADITAARELQVAIQLPPVDPNKFDQIANMKYGDVLAQAMPRAGDAEAGKILFRVQSCVNCHTFANGQQPKGPHLVDIGKRYKKRRTHSVHRRSR